MTDHVEEAERHRAKMAKRKSVQDAEVAEKTVEKGLLIVHTGAGKGKSTAAFGLALRMLGRGHRVGVVQFIKGAWHTAERDALARFGDQLVWHTMGEGFTWETQDRARDIEAAKAAWEKAKALIMDDDHDMVVLDELNIVLRYDYLDAAEIVAATAGIGWMIWDAAKFLLSDVVIGGLISATLLTLIVLPTLYLWVNERHAARRGTAPHGAAHPAENMEPRPAEET